ncbi:nitroreductase [Bradyrhizobium prioriisuperbiae]|uniref:nitroreductase n=1 Tax=Bradyrhizobium prioriisuperbiae TaxID=2854389 RepID=UPI0028E9D3D0|nr:nitroreductase [Bradyrhizobium prioritasuperba]
MQRSQKLDPDAVEYAITSRRSIRAFLPEPVSRDTIEHLLRVASRTPSGSNMQSWRVHVLLGMALAELTRELSASHRAGEPPRSEYHYYPTDWRSPYIERRRKAGWDLYTLAGIERGDRVSSERQRGRNYNFFGAPVGLIFVIDKYLERGSWLDFGMFLQNIMVAARGRDTCAQAALANFPAITRRHLAIPDDQMIICGMALGRGDPDDATNRLITGRRGLGRRRREDVGAGQDAHCGDLRRFVGRP